MLSTIGKFLLTAIGFTIVGWTLTWASKRYIASTTKVGVLSILP